MSDIPALLQPMKDRLTGITRGEWTVYDRGIGYEVHSDGFILNMGHKETFTKADATLIASAPTDQAKLIAAVEQVAALHKPFEWGFGFGPVLSCRGCADQGVPQEAAEYPCATVRALTQALGGDTA